METSGAMPNQVGSTSQTAVDEPERRPQAEPLPSKRGEIGFIEGVHDQPASQQSDTPTLPERHPADREQAGSPTTTPSGQSNTSPSSDNDHNNAASSVRKRRLFLGFFRPIVWGVHVSSLVIFIIQVLFVAGTIIAWVFATKLVKRLGSGQTLPGGISASVFAHIVFIIAVIGQLVFLERRVFRLRCERWSYLHPGEILPRHRNNAFGIEPGLAFAPWNRPPLPTYAAALAQNGYGTGDVEDHIIAAPPPPAYGNTRGSTMLLSGYMRQSLLAQRPASVHTQAPPNSRPVSYTSTDQNWEGAEEAERARRLEETLSRLENTNADPTRPTQGASRP